MNSIPGKLLVSDGEGLLIAWDDVRCGVAYRHFGVIALSPAPPGVMPLHTLAISEDETDASVEELVRALSKTAGVSVSQADIEDVCAQVDDSILGVWLAGTGEVFH